LLRFEDHTQVDTQPVGLIWTSDQPVAEAAEQEQDTNIHVLSGIQTRDTSNQNASGLPLAIESVKNKDYSTEWGFIQ
jgi:hypothetical protein